MNQVIIVGCDLHDRSLLLKAACGMDAPQQKSFLNDCDGRQAMLDFLLAFAQQHQADRIVFVYEASGQGYGLYDFLTDQGIECYVLSPSHLPKSAKQKRNKTDAKDAQMLLERERELTCWRAMICRSSGHRQRRCATTANWFAPA